MKNFRLFLAVALVALVASDCGQKSTEPALSDPASGVGELPAAVQKAVAPHLFGDDDLIVPLDLANPGLATPGDSGYDIYAVTMLWGDFFPSGMVEPWDWSGMASVNGEAVLRPVALIDFERGQDSLLPVDCRCALAWQSIVQQDFDGISFLLLMKRGVVYITPPVLTIDTEPLHVQIIVESLARFAAFYPIGDRGGLAVVSKRLKYPPCPHGLIGGKWIKSDSTDRRGRFEGLWMDGHSQPLGVMTGEFWTEASGERVLKGTVSGVAATVVLFELEGRWFYDDPRMCMMCGSGHGQFFGRFHDLRDGSHGKFGGEFGDLGLPPGERAMPMRGIWRQFCDHVAGDWANPDD